MQTPVYTLDEARARETFLALMWAFSYPARIQILPEAETDPFHEIAATLLDLETSYYTPDMGLATILARTGARALEPERAAYHFYPTLAEENLETVERASAGSMLYPDQGATLVIGCLLGAGLALTLTGPGIRDAESIEVGGLPDVFWTQRDWAINYPLGWDVFLVDGRRVLGLPRTTMIETGKGA